MKHQKRCLLVFLATVVQTLGMCCLAQPPSPSEITLPSDSNVVITLERTLCFGACPAYKITIYRNGLVRYLGNSYVKVTGEQSGRISTDTLALLVRTLCETNFFDFKDRYEESITDLPTTITSLAINGKTKVVVDYFGAPESLHRLESQIDDVAVTEHWTGVKAARRRFDSLWNAGERFGEPKR